MCSLLIGNIPVPQLLPCPRKLSLRVDSFSFPRNSVLHLESGLSRDAVMLQVADRLREVTAAEGVTLEVVTGPPRHPRLAVRAINRPPALPSAEAYDLDITSKGITISYREIGGLRAAVATLRQLIRQYGRCLPGLRIEDQPDFTRRGVMLDVSRGRVPRLDTLLELVSHLADFKINELQLYTEHTFAYRNFEPVWKQWSAITGEEILRLDERCRRLGIELVPNQNSFGHLRYWLEYQPLKKLAEISQPYEGSDGTFLRYPTTLAPLQPGTIPFLRDLFDELLPHFTSSQFNVGCDETWDLGRGRSKATCALRGKGRVYLDFLKQIHHEVSSRRRRMMFWGDIILHYPELIRELPQDIIALNWGYEAEHPFEKETETFSRAKVPFYVCPGTSTWMTLIGRHDNAIANLSSAARWGIRNGALGYLNTDWGDGGHPQPLSVSYVPYLAGASLSWFAKSFDEKLLVPVLSRDVFEDPTRRVAAAAMAMGFAHRKFNYFAPNVTPFGAVIAAPIPRTREIPCRDGLKYYARIPAKNIRAALDELEHQRKTLTAATPIGTSGQILATELDLAARMAAQSCHIMLWQQALAAGKLSVARAMARTAIPQLRDLDDDFVAYWPVRNKGTTAKCCPWLKWRIMDYQKMKLHFPPEVAAPVKAA